MSFWLKVHNMPAKRKIPCGALLIRLFFGLLAAMATDAGAARLAGVEVRSGSPGFSRNPAGFQIEVTVSPLAGGSARNGSGAVVQIGLLGGATARNSVYPRLWLLYE